MRWLGIAMLGGYLLMMPGCKYPLLDGVGPLPKYTAPYGAYYVKAGMTREERLQDLTACGTHTGLIANFTKEQAEEASKATDEFVTGKNNNGYFVLRRRLESCMASKGYQKLPMDTCEGNDPKVLEPCMYP